MSRLGLAVALLAASVPAAAQQPAQRQVAAGLPAPWRPALAAVWRLFAREHNPRPACFTVSAGIVGDALSVNFTPGRPLPQDRHLRGGRTSCGREVTFLIARDGALLRRTYSR